jgi:hypothetical protein
MAGTDVLSNAAQTITTGTFSCAGTTACPGGAGTRPL